MRLATVVVLVIAWSAACAGPAAPAATTAPSPTVAAVPTTAIPTSTPVTTAGATSPLLRFELTDVRNGSRFTLGGFRGKTVLVLGMAVW